MNSVTPPTTDEFATQLPDREAIRDCLARYARGFDQGEPELVRSAFWPDARPNTKACGI